MSNGFFPEVQIYTCVLRIDANVLVLYPRLSLKRHILMRRQESVLSST